MNKKTIFTTVAIIALVVQLSPVWLFNIFWTFWRFFIEKIFEGGLFKEVVLGIDQAGNSIVGHCLNNSSCVISTLSDGFLSILFILGVVIPILSLFSIKRMDAEQIYTKHKNIIFVIFNILIISTVVIIILNNGLVSRGI